jgi:hypothetical protein
LRSVFYAITEILKGCQWEGTEKTSEFLGWDYAENDPVTPRWAQISEEKRHAFKAGGSCESNPRDNEGKAE